MSSQTIYCSGCQGNVEARLTSGKEIYPHRPDLSKLPFWRCDACGNYVGCHHKTSTPTKPLGVIPTPELRTARSHIHAILDPIWKSGRMKRGKVYRLLSDRLGYEFHTAEIRSIEQARTIYRTVLEIAP